MPVKRNLRSLFDRHEPGALAFLFCQLILRAFIESLYILARTRTSGGKSSLRSLTYHRSLVVDRSTLPFKPYRQSLISKGCNERGTFTSVGSKPQAVGRQSWEKRFGEGGAECVALGDAVHRAPPPIVHAVLRHRAVDPPNPALVPFPSAVLL